ncbi:MAG: patatin-like phospholipase family protein [Aquihabitans sp.]
MTDPHLPHISGEEAGIDDVTPGQRGNPESDSAADPDLEAVLDTALHEDRLARAQAELMLVGPGLHAPTDRLSPRVVEESWGPEAREGLDDLRRDLSDQRLGLAISGGGALGSFEAGVLRFVYDHLDIEPVAICGNSAGALNAAKLAEGSRSDRPPIDEVERIWRSLRVNADMWEPEPWLVRLQASATWASDLREQVGDPEGAANSVRVVMRVVSSLVRRPPETDGTIDAIRDALRAQSLLSLAPIAELVERELDSDAIRRSGVELRVGTVSLEAGELRYVTGTGEVHDRADQPMGLHPVDLAQAIVASASIPVAFPPVPLNEEHYVDGGAREILPLELLVGQLGVTRVIAVSASSGGIRRAPSFADRGLLDILRRVSAEIGPNETLRRELKPPGGWPEGVRLVIPEFDVHDAMTIDPALIAISIDHGYLRAADVLLDLGEEAAALTTDLTRVRIDLRHLAGPIPTLFGDARSRTETPAPVDGDGPATHQVTDELDQQVSEITPDPDPVDAAAAAAALTSRLRQLVLARQSLGAPLSPSLLAWLDEPDDRPDQAPAPLPAVD